VQRVAAEFADPASISTITNVVLALGLGLLIGVQRGWALRDAPDGTRFAGIRTFGLIALAGGLAGILRPIAPGEALILMAASAALILLGYVRMSKCEGSVSGTASLVGLLTLGCGYLATIGQGQVASTIAVLVTLVLALRSQLHHWLEHLTELEVGAIARFALIAGAILPLLPDRAYGPFDAWNPRHLWLVVVMVSGVSFAGYIACKRFGARNGTLATAGAGALVSSTAVTAALAGRLRDGNGNRHLLSAAIALASAVMSLRVLALVAALAPEALSGLAVLLLPGTIASALTMAWMLRAAERERADEVHHVAIRNPFDLAPAIGMMVLLNAVRARVTLDAGTLRSGRPCRNARAVGRDRCRQRDHNPRRSARHRARRANGVADPGGARRP
jgi:uncharacterized membrane protein (DUF4010 family)